jgi:hypothetical protein
MDKNANPLNNFILASTAQRFSTSSLASLVEGEIDNITRLVFEPTFASILTRTNRARPESGIYYADQEGNLHSTTRQADPRP